MGRVAAIALVSILALLIIVSVLAEANRSPFDFAEGESELVSGFNTEYARVLFVILFLAEYISIIFMSMLCRLVFLAAYYIDLGAPLSSASFTSEPAALYRGFATTS